METINDLNPDSEHYHLGIYGKSGSGKSYLANKMYEQSRSPAIFFNYPDKEADDYSISGRRFSYKTSKKKIAQALKQGDNIKYRPSSDFEKAKQELKALYAIVKELEGEYLVFIDEGHRFVGQILSYILDDGRGHKVRFIFITQYPKRVKDQSKYGKYALQTIEDTGRWVIFNVSQKQKGFFDYYQLPYQEVKQLVNDKEYVFGVIEDQDLREVAKA